ncbi:MAG: response regulator transcription factor [Bacteroidetes bacterium]|jgi:DNA-binding NarL/FixJ family response regulator|nr:response regulator transcription factor [Bacteroidota bacterium]MBT6687617.1 response regulator transcription factor [Bacteroidota bacterium]MBT7144750.1 response regulator transcription factor [Bacteroidota bacterium]MBT7491762.1 response regulator transcription factor [Bacteroidota bacterium]
MSKIEVILVDDHNIVRDGIKMLLLGNDEIEIVEEAGDSDELFKILATKKPNIILLDISLPKMSGIEIAKRISSSSEFSDIKIVILSSQTDEQSIIESLDAGAKGYLPKNTTRDELINTIIKVHEGEIYLNQTVSNILSKSYFSKKNQAESKAYKILNSLTQREVEIIRLFAEGNSYKEIANRLFISNRTVESHKNNIMNKLQLKSIVDLTKFAIKNGIIEL